MSLISRNSAYQLVTEWVQSPALRAHMRAVEAAMIAYAKHFQQNEEAWAIAGLLHDFDYERYPTIEQHPFEGVKVLRELGYPEEILDAIMGHGNHTNTLRTTLMAKSLFACDELCGFIVACAYVRPNKLADLEAKSVIKKLKDKGFAAAVNRDDITRGVTELGVDLNEHITRVIEALRPISQELGL